MKVTKVSIVSLDHSWSFPVGVFSDSLVGRQEGARVLHEIKRLAQPEKYLVVSYESFNLDASNFPIELTEELERQVDVKAAARYVISLNIEV